MKNIAGLAGLAPNEKAIQMFQRMDMRTFEFTFELIIETTLLISIPNPLPILKIS